MSRFSPSALLLALALAPTSVVAQGVLVAPHTVVIDHRTRSGSLTLYNPGDEPAEVALSTFFGYPVTDSTGDLRASHRRPAASPARPPRRAGSMPIPKRMLLGPKQRQTVRLLARPPAGLPDGEYWARVAISAKGGSVPVSGVTDSSGVQVALALEIRTVIPLQYRKGKVATGVRTSDLAAAVEGDSLAVRLRLDRTGNAAFLGTLRGALVDAKGQTVASVTSPLAVYYDMEPRLTAPLPAGGLPAGTYRLKIDVASVARGSRARARPGHRRDPRLGRGPSAVNPARAAATLFAAAVLAWSAVDAQTPVDTRYHSRRRRCHHPRARARAVRSRARYPPIARATRRSSRWASSPSSPRSRPVRCPAARSS